MYIQQLAYMDLSCKWPHRPPTGPRAGRLTSSVDDAVDTVIWAATESAATIVAASIPVLRKFLKQKIISVTTYVQKGSTGRSKKSEQRTADQSKGARQSIHLSNLSKGTSSKSRSQTYAELDDLDDESERSILQEHGDQPRGAAGLQMPPPVGLAV